MSAAAKALLTAPLWPGGGCAPVGAAGSSSGSLWAGSLSASDVSEDPCISGDMVREELGVIPLLLLKAVHVENHRYDVTLAHSTRFSRLQVLSWD